MIPVVYIIGGILVRTGAKKVAEQLIKAGAKKATQKIIQSFKGKVQNATPTNINTIIKKAKQGPPQWQGPRIVRQGPNKPPTTGGSKPSPVNKPAATTKPGPTAKANQQPRLSSGSTSRTVVRIKPKSATSSTSKIVSATPTIAGLVAAGALGKVAYDAYIEKYNPTVTQIKAAEKKIKAATKDNRSQPSKEGSLVGDAGTKGRMQEARRMELAAKKIKETLRKIKAAELAAAKADAVKRDTPDRKRRIDRTVQFAAVGKGAGLKKMREDADKKALTEILNKKIASRKSTAAKEKAKARAGEYKSLASAKKAGSLYYMHKGKELRAAITREETESASKRIRGEAMKKIAEGK